MKNCRIIFFALLVAGLHISNPILAQNGFLTQENVPNDLIYLPAPPADGSDAFIADSALYQSNKALRTGERGRQAIADVYTSTDSILKSFSPAFGMSITKEKTPEMYKLISMAKTDIRLGVNNGKKTYMRTRPYVHFNESTPLPEEDRELRYTGSYPSGHSVRGWGIALLLAEINPDRQDAILERGFQYGQSRVILGFHYQSDVDAARFVASAVVARLHADKNFARQMKRAKREFARLSH